MRISQYIDKALAWRRKYVSERNFLLFASAITGIIAGLAAILLKQVVHLIDQQLTAQTYLENYFQLAYPIIGILLTVLLAKLLYREKQGHSITDILYSISKRSGLMEKRKTYSRMITSAITVGFGGSGGLESPIVLTGSAIGSNIARIFLLNYKTRVLMIGCGTAAVISAIFNAPIAGLIFSIEVIFVDITISNFIPLLIASATANLTSIILHKDSTLFAFKQVDSFAAQDLPYYFALAVICGFTAIYFTKILLQSESYFKKIKNNYTRALIGGISLTAMIVLFPPVYGEGYIHISEILNSQETNILKRSLFMSNMQNQWFILVYIAALVFIKTLASSVTIASGGSAGTFAPSLFLGGFAGFAFARLINLFGIAQISEVNFALVGMCGVLSGTQYAPLTAIFLIAELTGGYTLFIPLMIVSAIAFTTVSYFDAHSPYVRELIRRGDLVRGNKDKKILNNLQIHKVIETDLQPIHHAAMLEDLIKLISKSKRNIFPVIDDKGKLVGIITLDNVREVMFSETKQKSIKIASLMEQPPALISHGENMEQIMRKFESTQAWNLPVIADGVYKGFVSKSRIFNIYRKELIMQD